MCVIASFSLCRHKLYQANDKLKKVLIEMLRSTVATEELIGKKVNTRSNISEEATHQRSSLGKNDVQESGQSFKKNKLFIYFWLLLVDFTHQFTLPFQ